MGYDVPRERQRTQDTAEMPIQTVMTADTADERHLLGIYRSLNDSGKKSLLKQADLHAKDEDFTIKASGLSLSGNAAI